MDQRINPVRYPTLSRYLAQLPQSLISYPQAQTLGQLATVQLSKYPQLLKIVDLPADVMSVVQRPYSNNSWIPEVHLMCISALVRDVVYRSDEAYLQSRFEIMQSTIRSGFFRAALSLLSPSLLALSVERHWRSAKKGVQLNTLAVGKGERTIQLVYPDNLYLRCMLEGFAKAFEGILSICHAKNFSSETKILSPAECHIVFQWET